MVELTFLVSPFIFTELCLKIDFYFFMKEQQEENEDKSGDSLHLLSENVEVEEHLQIRLTNPKLFLQKTLVIVLASYAFIPLIALHNGGEISALIFALILVILHLAFIIIYIYKVKFRELDGDRRSLIMRILGLIVCVGLLVLVAEFLPDKLWLLAIELLGLCLVHTFILCLLMVEVRLPGSPKLQDIPTESDITEVGEIQ
jgi:hypothetical protein